ncbi:hypothetical protein ACGF07_14755 [Kitasatospora sp. NPDC048194]|uniref:hypothetical protein n=1 Tax=Kitasatospora sp. NPDC048194 TaxID=3364045 RepID=UPI00371BF261
MTSHTPHTPHSPHTPRSPHLRPPPREPRPDTVSGEGMSAQVADLAAEAERQVREGLWDFAPQDQALARKTADGLAEAVGSAADQERLPVIERLEDLREALAVLAIGLARTHGRLAWFLARASTVLAPVLHWRALPADRRHSFGTVVPTPHELADAEGAVRRLHTVLARTDAVAIGPQRGLETAPDASTGPHTPDRGQAVPEPGRG